MGDWILRAEGVNLVDTVFNTNDLSTVRGSSLALEAFVHDLSLWLGKQKTVRKISKVYYGGSQVAFLIDDISENQAEDLASDAREYLNHTRDFPANWPPYWDYINNPGNPPDPVKDSLYLEPPTEHLRFVVEIAQIKKTVREAVNKTLWQSRRRQMLAPNLPISPGANAKANDIAARVALLCPVDPAQTLDLIKNQAGQLENNEKSVIWVAEGQYPKAIKANSNSSDGYPIYTSKRSADLHTYGRDARRMLYPVQLKNAKVKALVQNGLFRSHDFSQSFHQIVANAPDGISESVKGKLAYLYFDGNRFSDIRAENDLGVFADAVENINAHVLDKLVTAFLPGGHDKDKPARMFSKGRVFVRKAQKGQSGNPTKHDGGKTEVRELLRMETLLFGGEDFLVVLPAWLAWEFAWKILGWYGDGVNNHAGSLTGKVMTHRCGLLICDQKMPVRRARDIAYALCDDAKRAYVDKDAQAALAFHIIESHDIPEETADTETNISLQRRSLYSVLAGRKDRLSADTTAKAFRVLGASHKDYQNALVELKSAMAHSRLYRLINDLDSYSGDDPDGFLLEKLAEYTTKGRTKATTEKLKELLDEGKHPEVPWNLHLKILADLWDYVDPFDDVAAAAQGVSERGVS